MAVEDQAGAFKRAFASTLIVLRGESGLGSQGNVAAKVPTSEATYRRWENMDAAALPDAWQINRLCELLDCNPGDLIHPEPLTDREVEMARRLGRLRQAAQEAAHADAGVEQGPPAGGGEGAPPGRGPRRTPPRLLR